MSLVIISNYRENKSDNYFGLWSGFAGILLIISRNGQIVIKCLKQTVFKGQDNYKHKNNLVLHSQTETAIL